MAEQVFVVAAGSRPICEIVKSEDGQTLTIRSASNHNQAIAMPSSIVHALIGALQEFTNTPQPGPATN
jgi:hypothetical protein